MTNDCDPFENRFTLHGVEICLLDLHFSKHPAADMDMIFNAIKKNKPDVDIKEAAAEIRTKIAAWRNRRQK